MRMEVRNESPIAEGPTTLTTFFPKLFPKSPLIRNPIAGNTGINQTFSSMKNSSHHCGFRIADCGFRISDFYSALRILHSAIGSPLQEIDLIDIDRFS